MMAQRVINVNVPELMPGMIISKDIIRNDNVLLKEGSIVNEDIIDKLDNLYLFDSVEVYAPEEIIGKSKKAIEMKKVEQAFQEVSEELKELSSKIDSLDENNIDDLRKFAWKIEDQLRDTDIVLSSVLFKGDAGDHIYKHGVNTAVLSALLAKWLGIKPKEIDLLIYAALLHDFGVTKLSEELQRQPDLITDKVTDEVREHVRIAYESIKCIPNMDKSVIYGVLMHHERCDGSGYPLRIKGDKIPSFAKIIAIADEFDVLNSNKWIMDKPDVFHSLKIIKEKSFKYLDYKYSKIFLEHIFNFYIGEEVRLSNGSTAKVLQINMEDIENPLLFDGNEFINLEKNNICIKELIIK